MCNEKIILDLFIHSQCTEGKKSKHLYQGNIGVYKGVVILLRTNVELILNYLPQSSIILLNLQGGVNIKPLQLISCQLLMLVWQMYGVYVLVHK